MDPNRVAGRSGFTPLHHASARGHEQVVRLLLAQVGYTTLEETRSCVRRGLPLQHRACLSLHTRLGALALTRCCCCCWLIGQGERERDLGRVGNAFARGRVPRWVFVECVPPLIVHILLSPRTPLTPSYARGTWLCLRVFVCLPHPRPRVRVRAVAGPRRCEPQRARHRRRHGLVFGEPPRAV